ncbi:MAG TPA: hypothetical protein VEJ38_15285 [Candidatus Acidoferrales bacterium]|nr:hypothetical protein [Candidatus Acidoferrales bacterium]
MSCGGNSACARSARKRGNPSRSHAGRSGSDEGNFFALDAVTGKPLWDIYSGSSLRSNLVTYSVDGKQYVFVTAGTTYFVFSLP